MAVFFLNLNINYVYVRFEATSCEIMHLDSIDVQDAKTGGLSVHVSKSVLVSTGCWQFSININLWDKWIINKWSNQSRNSMIS